MITLDLNMPGLKGFEILEELKTNPATNTVPVAIITSKLLSDSERQELAYRADVILSKSQLGDAVGRSNLSS